jgi:hypothetical protein
MTRDVSMFKKIRTADNWTKLIAFFLCFGGLLGKASGYIGLLLGGLLLFCPRILWDRWYVALTRRTDLLNAWSWLLLASLLLGFAELGYGLMLGYPLLTALEILVFNLCPVYVFLGVWIGARHPGFLRQFTRFSAIYAVIYTPIYFLFLSKLNLSLTGLVPGNDLDVFGNPGSGSITILGLLCYEASLTAFWLPLLVLTCLTIANQERSDWVGLILALGMWGFLTKRLGRVVGITAIIAAILGVAALVDLKLPAIAGRGGELSARGTISRMAGAISPELAQEVGGDRANAHFYYGTVYWRKHWWANIRSEVSKTWKTQIIGLGYGYPLARLADSGTQKEGTRSPHNILYFCYAYSGFVGVAIFVVLELCMFRILWRVFRTTGQVFGLLFFSYQIVQALFGNSIETPQAGVVVYILVGLAIGPAFRQTYNDLELEDGEPLDALPLSMRPDLTEVMEHARRV